MRPSRPRSSSSNLALAPAIRGVCTAPPAEAFSSETCLQPSVARARRSSASIAAVSPEQRKPSAKSSCAIWQTQPPPPLSSSASTHSLSTASRRKPAMESCRCGEASAASCIASPRNRAIRSPVATSKTPAKVRAASSPRERPATARHRSKQPGLLCRSRSTAANALMKSTGWQSRVSSNQTGMASGPLKSSHTPWMGDAPSGSKPNVALRLSSMAGTPGKFRAAESNRKDLEFWSGNKRPTGSD
mmetsp:Transcript_102595/g.328728  ORF Transcript_102595/g.328728 Transcript_102595/m.328728 type:complete len:245 (+) Transcript_102595:292-1026(+)